MRKLLTRARDNELEADAKMKHFRSKSFAGFIKINEECNTTSVVFKLLKIIIIRETILYMNLNYKCSCL